MLDLSWFRHHITINMIGMCISVVMPKHLTNKDLSFLVIQHLLFSSN